MMLGFWKLYGKFPTPTLAPSIESTDNACYLVRESKTNEYGALHSSGLFSPLVDPVYSFHNHSCESPMIHIEDATTGRCLVTAQRNIAKGEEVFTNYLSKEILNTNTKEERHNKLQGWLAGPCFCARCKREGKFQATWERISENITWQSICREHLFVSLRIFQQMMTKLVCKGCGRHLISPKCSQNRCPLACFLVLHIHSGRNMRIGIYIFYALQF